MKHQDIKKVFESRSFSFEQYSLTLNVPYGAKYKGSGEFDSMHAIGNIVIGINTPHGPTSMPFDFKFDSYGEIGIIECVPEVEFDPIERYLQICFSTFEEVAKKAFEQLKQKRQEENLIVPASKMPPKDNVIKMR